MLQQLFQMQILKSSSFTYKEEDKIFSSALYNVRKCQQQLQSNSGMFMFLKYSTSQDIARSNASFIFVSFSPYSFVMSYLSVRQRNFVVFCIALLLLVLQRFDTVLYVHDMLMFYFQSNILELWSLFDFLMPGFLGSEKQFQSRFGKPILQSRDAKSSSKEQEAGECPWIEY